MGADKKRKEARKRKFILEGGHIHPDTLDAQTTPVLQVPSGKQEQQFLRRTTPTTSSITPTKETRENERSDMLFALEEESKPEPQKTQRFIVFIGLSHVRQASIQNRLLTFSLNRKGNLPYTATEDVIKRHFAAIQPDSVRHRVDRVTEKSKGFAFLEFSGYDRMKTCLKLYHHSLFDNKLSPARRLNVELT